MVLRNRPTLSIGTERLACLNNPMAWSWGPLPSTRQVPDSSPGPGGRAARTFFSTLPSFLPSFHLPHQTHESVRVILLLLQKQHTREHNTYLRSINVVKKGGNEMHMKENKKIRNVLSKMNVHILKALKEKQTLNKYTSIIRDVTGQFFWGGKVIFPDFFPSVKCFFLVENFHFGRPKTNFSSFEKWE